MERAAMSLTAKTVTIAAVVSIAAILSTYTASVPSAWQGSATDFYLSLAAAIGITVTHSAAGILFLLALPDYKAEMKFAYRAIAFGVFCTAIGTLQLPIISAYNLVESLWVRSGIVIVPFLLSGLAIYIGARRLAKLVEIKTKLLRVGLVVPGIIVLAAISTLLPHGPIIGSEVANDISNAILIWTGLLYVIALIIMLKIRSRVGSHYTNAIAWLAIALFGGVVIVGISLGNAFVLRAADQYNAVIDILTLINGSIFLKAGLAFNKTRDY